MIYCLSMISTMLPGLCVYAGQVSSPTAKAMGHPDEVQEPKPTGPLLERIEQYFRCEDPARRRQIERNIEEIAGGNTAAVALAVEQVNLWTDLEPGPGRFSVTPPSGKTIEVGYVIPDDYDPGNRYPLMVCLPSQKSTTADTLNRAEALLGDLIQPMLRIAPSRAPGGAFWMPTGEAEDFPALVRAVRRRFHVDTDRVYLFGTGEGADAAWQVAIAYPDLLAGVIAVSGYPAVPYAEQVYPFLLTNLSRVWVLGVWWWGDSGSLTDRAMFVAAHNQAIAGLADSMSWPTTIVQGRKVEGRMTLDLGPSDLPTSGVSAFQRFSVSAFPKILSHRRPPPEPQLSHWFRYPGQGRCGWLRQARFDGPVWESTQLAILPGPGVDRDEFIADVVKSKLAYLGGAISGQKIDIEAKRCERIEVLLPDGLIDFDQPIRLMCNGKKRYEGRVRKKISTMLQEAYRQWEFHRPIWVKLSFHINSLARQQ